MPRMLMAEPIDFAVERNGFVQSVVASWKTPQLMVVDMSQRGIDGLVADGWMPITQVQPGESLKGYDGGYLVQGEGLVVDMVQCPSPGEESRSVLVSDLSASLMASSGVPKSVAANVDYGTSARFSLSLSLVFYSVVLKGAEEDRSLGTVNVVYAASEVYRQPDDTESWGSPNQKVLYWYWQDVR